MVPPGGDGLVGGGRIVVAGVGQGDVLPVHRALARDDLGAERLDPRDAGRPGRPDRSPS